MENICLKTIRFRCCFSDIVVLLPRPMASTYSEIIKPARLVHTPRSAEMWSEAGHGGGIWTTGQTPVIAPHAGIFGQAEVYIVVSTA